MTVLWILLGIAAVCLLIGAIPLSVTAIYDGDGPNVTAKAGPVKILLYPRPETGNKSPKKEKKKKSAEAEDTPKKKKKLTGGAIDLFRELIGLVIEAQAHLRNKLHLQELTVYLTLGGLGDDPAKAAKLYGTAWAALGNLIPLLEQVFVIKNRDVQAFVDFLSEDNTVYAKATARITLGAVLKMGVYFGLRGLKLFWKHKKKGGKINGTSH